MSMPTAPDPNAPHAKYNASCHCGAFAYTVNASPPFDDPSAVTMECNCSICARNGYLLIYVPNDNIVFTKGDIKDFKAYQFNKMDKPNMNHYFCGTCGASCLIRSCNPDFFQGMTCVNVRMFEDIDVKTLNLKSVDGKSF